jgi:HPt (histidine-containing phosphotransfer) domain-containing protein
VEIRKLPGEKGIPGVVAMTAFAMDGDKEKCFDAGMDDYITKPIRIENIQSVIEKWGTKKHSLKKNETQLQNTIEPIIDYAVVERLKELAPKDDATFLKNLIEMFSSQVATLVIELEDLTNSGDLDSVHKAAHKLKGSSANMGAKRLAECCKKIELLSRDKNANDLINEIENLKVVKDLTLRELNKL